MPTNLKSLLSRSRSRNELKSREKGEDITSESESNGANNGCGSNTDVVNGNCGINGGTSSGCSSNGQFRCCAIPGDESGFRGCCNPSVSNGMKSDPNYSNLFLSCSTLNHSSPGTTDSSSSTTTTGATSTVYTNGTTTSTKNATSRCGSPFATCSTVQQEDFSPRQSLAMRKCETVLALSSFTGSQTTSSPTTNSTSPFNSVGSASASTTTSASGPNGKVKVMKDKIFSTSSSTLNCLLHSTNRSKLFSGWKLSSTSTNGHNNSNSSGSGTTATQMYPGFFIDDVSVTRGSSVTNDNALTIADVQQISKSQLSIPETNVPLTPLNRLRRNISINNAYFSLGANSSYSRSSSMASFGWREKEDFNELDILCRLCLCNVKMDETVEILACACRYCKDCVMAYVSFEIQEGAEEIACPDATCEKQGVLTLPEIESLMPSSMVEKHKKFRLYREVEKDGHLMWCPSPGCETVCRIQETIVPPPLDGKVSKPRSSSIHKSLIINCGTCRKSFCAECKLSWHPGTSCEAFRRKLVKQGKLSLDDEELFSLESIKKCPFCHVPIEKDSGCAQMMCKRCKHVFCWYCLASLDDDFLLRHYDKGPCKNKLGHSRASVVWHRAQVIGIFAGFGVLVLLASPLLILAAPCLLCCRCRYCANKTETEESPVPV